MKIQTLLVAALATAGLAFAAAPGTAVIDQLSNISFIDDSEIVYTLDKFDPAIGELVGVQFGIELDGEWNDVVTNTGTVTDSVALGWDSSLAGYYPPTPADIGAAGYSLYGVTIDVPGSGVFSRVISRPVSYSDTLAPGVPQTFQETVDTPLVYSSVYRDLAVIRAVQGRGTFQLNVSTVGLFANSGLPQGTIGTNYSADGTIAVRYIYK